MCNHILLHALQGTQKRMQKYADLMPEVQNEAENDDQFQKL